MSPDKPPTWVVCAVGAAWCAVIHSWATQPRRSGVEEAAAVAGTLAMAAWTVFALTYRAGADSRVFEVKVWALVLGTALSGLTACFLLSRFLPVPPAYQTPVPPPTPYREAVRVGGRSMSVDVYRMYDPEAGCYVYFTGSGGAMTAHPAHKEKGQP